MVTLPYGASYDTSRVRKFHMKLLSIRIKSIIEGCRIFGRMSIRLKPTVICLYIS